jgi:hypothetical protein
MKPELHPACAAFPQLPDADLRALADDIKAKGLLEPITLTSDGLLLDGRCRWDGCELAGVEPLTVVYTGNDPLGFVVSKNRHRRHLNAAQKALALAKIATLQRGTNRYQKKVDGLSQATHSRTALAELGGISISQIGFAKRVLKNGAPHIIRMLEDGAIGTELAAQAISGVPLEAQAGWTVDDVRRKGMAIIGAYPSNQPGAKPIKKPKPTPPRTIDIPYGTFKFPTAEETGAPTSGATLGEQYAFHERYGRTPMHPKVIKHLLESEGRTSGLTLAIVSTSNASHPDVDQFFTDIDEMLAYVPDKTRGGGYETDFAAKARRTLATLRARLPRALALLSALEQALKEHRVRPADERQAS